jgi:TrpR-related protein YerC/YecD
MNEKINEFIDELYSVLIKLETKEDCKALLADLCTYKEIEQMAQRIKAAELLLEGKTYSQVIVATDISSATLSRVSRCIQHGSGGYKKFVAYQKASDKE